MLTTEGSRLRGYYDEDVLAWYVARQADFAPLFPGGFTIGGRSPMPDSTPPKGIRDE